MKVKDFESAFDRCNFAQKEAINRIEGPVLVVAGPGTGKTQILSLRIGKILKETDAMPHNILCLTYTDAGTVAMRKRLLELIGPDSYRIHIHTFHSFCNAVIQDNREYFGGTFNLQPVTPLESIDIFYKLIDNFKTESPLKKFVGEIYSVYPRLKSLFETIKKENLSVDFLLEKANSYIDGLSTNPEFIYQKDSKYGKKGEPKQKKIEEATQKMEMFKAAVGEFSNYEALMKQHQRYDFNDMINWVIAAFHQNDTLLARYQEQYLYFLVDEFQDTNGAQIEILNLLTGYWDSPNVFAVGDDDQSIYSFQGAENERIKEFVAKYKTELYPVVLTDNYRSTQQILDLSGTLIEANKTRLIYDHTLKSIYEKLDRKLHKTLQSHKTVQEGKVEVRECYNSFHETAYIVKEIEEKLSGGADLSNIAIIYHNHRHIESLVKVFEHKKIPYNAKLKSDILKTDFIDKIISILQYISEENTRTDSAEHLLFEIMHFHFFKIEHRDIARLARECRERDIPWRVAIADKALLFKLGLETSSAISFLEDKLSYWQKEMHNVTLQVLFEKIISKGGIISYVMHSPEKIWLLQSLTAFFNFIKDESAKNPEITLAELLEMLEKMKANGIAISLDKIVYAENGVNLVTAHSSKGLEYETVYIINCVSDEWEKKRKQNAGFKFPPLSEIGDEAENDDSAKIEEERRLFYVAMTRAKQNLYISYPAMKVTDADIEKATIEKSTFVAELLEKTNVDFRKIHLENEALAEYALYNLLESPLSEVEKMERAFVEDALKGYRLSVTHLNKYLKCKLSFYFENILRVPTARSASMGFGNAIHYALEKLFAAMQQHPEKKFPSVDEFLLMFNKGLEKYESHFTKAELKLKKEYATLLLPDYYKQYINEWNKVVVSEYKMHHVVYESIPLSGALDKIEFSGNVINVVDYKTGSPDNAKKKLNAPLAFANAENDSFEKVHGGDYWRQIVFYKILIDNDKTKKWEMESGEIDFVQKNKEGKFEKLNLHPTGQDIAIVQSQIKMAYDGILTHDFYKGCGKEDCKWCNFVKNNFVEVPEEEDN